jgi:FeS assembly SUF system protein
MNTLTEIPDLKEKVIAVLKTIYDPEIPVDIWELGLIYDLKIFPINNVYVQMTLTSPNCPSAEQIPQEVKDKIKAIEGVNDVELELTFDPPYTTDMMSEAAKLELGFM